MTYHEKSSVHDIEMSATYDDRSTDSFVASWSATSTSKSDGLCNDEKTHYSGHSEGSGSGAGRLEPSPFAFPEEYGLDPDKEYTALRPQETGEYEHEDHSTDCNGIETTATNRSTPWADAVYLPYSKAQLADLPAGTELTDSYDKVVSDGGGTVTYTVTYTARKGPWSDDPECSDGFDNDADGRVDAPSDPGCTAATDTSEHGGAACDNGADDDGDLFPDYTIGPSSDPECVGPEDRDEAGPCAPNEPSSATYRTVTDIPGPNIHWYTTTVEASTCEAENGEQFITGLDVDRHAEGGPIPTALSLLGLETGTESPVEVVPDPFTKAKSASAEFTYTMCFDLTKLLDKVGARKFLEKKVEAKAEALIGKTLKKLGLKRIKKSTRRAAVRDFKDAVDAKFSAETVATMLNDKYHVPGKVARFMGRLVEGQTKDARDLVKAAADGFADSNALVNLSAEEAAERFVGKTFKELDELTTFCGGGSGEESNLLTWGATVYATVKGDGTASFTRTDDYLHPILTVVED